MSYDDAPPSSDDERILFRVADRTRRFAGALVDCVAALAVSYMVRASVDHEASFWPTWDEIGTWGDDGLHLGGAYFVGAALPMVFQAVLIARSGQSLGKLVMNTRIVDEEGRTADFYRGFVLRMLPSVVVGFIPVIGLATRVAPETLVILSMLVALLALADCALVFSTDNRTLHDRIAGTYVCVVGTQRILEEQRRARKTKGRKRKAA